MATLEEDIAYALHEALDRMSLGHVWAMDADRGLVTIARHGDPLIRLTVEDVARIAARVVEDHFPQVRATPTVTT